MLRALFALATASRKDSSATQPGAGTQARAAVLHIAAGNSPLFMTTVSMDILHPKSVQHRKSVMALVIFLIHKVRRGGSVVGVGYLQVSVGNPQD